MILEDGTGRAYRFSFDIGLDEEGDGKYRTRNDPITPAQRSNITERRGAIDIRCHGVDVIHGFMQKGEDRATLVVYEFSFDSRKHGRRVERAQIEFLFSSLGRGKDPEVVKIAHRGRAILCPTTQDEQISAHFDLNIPIGHSGYLGSGRDVRVSRTTTDATIVVGSVDLVKRPYGPPNGASWTLMENASQRTGIPNFFRTAVLLRRFDDELFRSAFRIKAKVDFKTSIKHLLGGKPEDDPIIYDPSIRPSNHLCSFDSANLELVNLDELGAIQLHQDDLLPSSRILTGTTLQSS
ncbi:hypothetical protein MCOR25_005170 [Pyricularia grisea]|nr:hypothetical protein MCOR25_005170 [Pyricularia grisea]